MDGEEIDEQGKSLALAFDTTIRLKWTLDKEGFPLFPPSVLEDGEEPLCSFVDWVLGMLEAELKASSSSMSLPVHPKKATCAPIVQLDEAARAMSTMPTQPVDLTMTRTKSLVLYFDFCFSYSIFILMNFVVFNLVNPFYEMKLEQLF